MSNVANCSAKRVPFGSSSVWSREIEEEQALVDDSPDTEESVPSGLKLDYPKVCHVTSVHNFNDNRIFYKEILSLKEKGYDVCFIAPNAPDEVRGVRIYSNAFRGGRVKRFFVQSFFRTLRHAVKAKAEIYHFHDPELMPAAFLLRCAGKKVVFDVHENLPAALLSKSYIKTRLARKLTSFLMNFVERFFFLFFNKIVTARPDISLRLKYFEPYTLRNFPILPSEEELSEQVDSVRISKTRKSVIYVGVMSAIRGTCELIEAFDQLDEFELWLLGPFGDEELERRLRSSKGWRNVQYFGVVEPHQIFGYIRRADAGIVTFWPEPNHIQTLATKPFEYMACGLPLIMSNFEYWREFFGDGSVYVDPKNPREIAHAIRDLLSNDGLMKSMGEANKMKSETEYNWYSEREQLFKLYSGLC